MPGEAAEGLLGCTKIPQVMLDVYAWTTLIQPPVYTSKRALSRTRGDSSSSQNRNDKYQRGVSCSSCFSCLKRTFVSVVGMTGHQLEHSLWDL